MRLLSLGPIPVTWYLARPWQCARCGSRYVAEPPEVKHLGDGGVLTTCPVCGRRNVRRLVWDVDRE